MVHLVSGHLKYTSKERFLVATGMVPTGLENREMVMSHYSVQFAALPPEFGCVGECFKPLVLKTSVP